MIVKFHFKGEPVYINSGSIIGIVTDISQKTVRHLPLGSHTDFEEVCKCIVYCEEPMGALTIDESAEFAATAWAYALEEIEDGVDYGAANDE